MVALPGKLVVLLLACVVFLSPLSVYGESVRLSEPQHNVESFDVTPDGRYIIYKATTPGASSSTVYSVLAAGGAPKKLFDITVTIRGPHQISADGRYVVFAGIQNGSIGLYSVPIDGSSPPLQLNLDLVYSGVDGFQVTPDGRQVVYSLDRDALDSEDLYIVPITGPASASVKIPGAGGGANIVAISPDSRYVVFSRSSIRFQLYSVPIRGTASAPMLIGEYEQRNRPITDVKFSGDYILFRDDVNASSVYEVQRVPLLGPASARTTLSAPLPRNTEVERFVIDSAGEHVVYFVKNQYSNDASLYSVPLTGSASSAVKLNQELTGGTIDKNHFALSANGQYVVYAVNYSGGKAGALYKVPTSGPASGNVVLHTVRTFSGRIRAIAVSNDSSRAVYTADDRSRYDPALYSVALTGSPVLPVKLSNDVPGYESSYDIPFRISADSQYIVSSAIVSNGPSSRSAYFYTSPIAGPAESVAKVSIPLDFPPSSFVMLPGDNRVVYMQNPSANTARGLFVTNPGQPAGGPPLSLSQKVFLPLLAR